MVFFEVIGLAYGFGAGRIRQALREMLGWTFPAVMEVIWKYTAPLVSGVSPFRPFTHWIVVQVHGLKVLFLLCLLMYRPLHYPDGHPYPEWAEFFGLSLSACSILVIPAYALYYLCASGRRKARIGEYTVDDDSREGSKMAICIRKGQLTSTATVESRV